MINRISLFLLALGIVALTAGQSQAQQSYYTWTNGSGTMKWGPYDSNWNGGA